MTPDPGRSALPRVLADHGRTRRPGDLTRRLWTFGPYLALFLVVFGGALFVLGDDLGKIVGACIILPGGVGGAVLVVASSLGMTVRGWGSRTGR
jgi:hypothetical protein